MLLIKNATIIDPSAKANGKKRDILIVEGQIKSIRAKITEPKATIVDAAGGYVSPAWIDVGVQSGDPGYEHRENLHSLARAAAAGGFSAVACLPNTQPCIHSKSEVLYIKNNTQQELVDFYPIGAVSQDCEGKDITEMYDMYHSGAVAFSDGSHAVQDNGMMMRALQYVKAFDGLILNQPHDQSIAGGGQMHEGMVSTSLGMKGIPALAEEIMAQRDIYLASYAESRIHLSNISTAGSVALLRKAKADGIKVSASVAAMNLALDDEQLMDFDSHYKVLPPLRQQTDIRALKRGLKSGTIDFISSNHCPLELEAKQLEFGYADFGAIGLETAFAVSYAALGEILTLEEFVRLFALRPRQLLRIPIPTIEENAVANLTIFHTNMDWVFSERNIYSKSKNTPFIGTSFKAKVLGVVNKGQHYIQSDHQ